jgi:steroid delta-isomerase
MTNPNFDDEDEKPLDPAVAQVETRVRRLMLIAGLTLGLGIFAVFAAILYRIVTADSTVSPPAVASSAADASAAAEAEAAVRSALAAWNADFNAGNAERICDLFAPGLRYDYRGFPERGYDDICALLRSSLADTTRTFSYALDIRDVFVSGDLAVVRLVWTLTVRPAGGGEAVTSREPGMDVFRRQPDGSWKIVRYIAYEE